MVKTLHAKHAKGKHDDHLVGLGDLRVLIVEDGPSFFAQALEIDYASEGTSFEDVKKRFEKGLMATITEHLKVYGDIKKLLQARAPQDAWDELYKAANAQQLNYSHVSLHKVPHKHSKKQKKAPTVGAQAVLPFRGIMFMAPTDSVA